MNVRQLFPPPDFQHSRLPPELEQKRYDDLIALAEQALELGVSPESFILFDHDHLMNCLPEGRRYLLDLQMDRLENLIKLYHANPPKQTPAAS